VSFLAVICIVVPQRCFSSVITNPAIILPQHTPRKNTHTRKLIFGSRFKPRF
jgi:hypothetical protein